MMGGCGGCVGRGDRRQHSRRRGKSLTATGTVDSFFILIICCDHTVIVIAET